MRNRDEEAAAWFVALLAAEDITTLWPEFERWLAESPENDRAFNVYERLAESLQLNHRPED